MLPSTCFTRRHRIAPALAFLAACLLSACSSVPESPTADPAMTPRAATPRTASSVPALPPAGSGRGGYYMDDGPGDAPPEGLWDTPDAEPRVEPYSTRANRPYVVFGKSYTPITDERPFKQRGIGSWYGKKFHGQKTSSGELYDMYKMTAAHPTLPIPSYVRVTNLSNGRQVIVRVNDRGPFHSGRIIDLSYTAALKLGYLGKGSSQLEVERLLPEDIARIAEAKAAAASQVQEAVSGAEAVGVDTVASSPVVSSPAASLAPGFYLQLGAYTQPENAAALRSRLMQVSGGKSAQMEIVEFGALHRLYSGPYATRAAAEEAARQLQQGGAIRAMIVQR